MGSVGLKEEYQALREEMLHRFEKVYDAEKYGVGSILALMGYLYLGNSNDTAHFDKIIALILLESLILILGIFVMNEFMMIYRIGTYIALFCEGKDANSAKWIRMSRRGHEYLPQSKLKLGFPFKYGWGSDARQFAIVLIVLQLASLWSTGVVKLLTDSIANYLK